MHIYSLTYGQSVMICFYMIGLSANFTMREVASSANIYANCHYDIYQDTFSPEDTQFLQVIGFHGFILFSVSLIPVYYHRIWYFPVMCVKRRGVHTFLHYAPSLIWSYRFLLKLLFSTVNEGDTEELGWLG